MAMIIKNSNHTSKRSAFSLVELLAVIAIMAILGGLVISVMGGVGKSQSLDSATRALNTAFQSARNTALMKGVTTRVIINNDPTDRDRYLNFAGIIYKDKEIDDETGEEAMSENTWLALNEGVALPRGNYVYTADVSKEGLEATTEGYVTLSEKIKDESGGTMSIVYPSLKPKEGGDGTQWLYFEFTNEGITTPTSANKTMAVSMGRRDGDLIMLTNPFEASILMVSMFGGSLLGDFDDL